MLPILFGPPVSTILSIDYQKYQMERCGGKLNDTEVSKSPMLSYSVEREQRVSNAFK